LCFAANNLCGHVVLIENKDVRIPIYLLHCSKSFGRIRPVAGALPPPALRDVLSPPPSSFGGFSATCGLRFFLSKQGFDAEPAGP
jgi:hypothetical protein